MIKNAFLTRSLSGLIFVIILVGAIIINSYTFLLAFSGIALLGVHEFMKMHKKYIPRTAWIIGIVSSLATLILFITGRCLCSSTYPALQNIISTMVIATSIILLISYLINPRQETLAPTILGLLPLLYVCTPFILFMDLGFIGNNYSPNIPLFIIGLIWLNDTGAYLTGKLIGKHPLYKAVSPNKTIEGLIGGTIICLAGGALIFSVLSKEWEFIGKFAWFPLGLIVSVFGPIGDLIESKLKRSLKIKDSGSIMPGHGGVLDRFDSLLIIAPIITFYLNFIS